MKTQNADGVEHKVYKISISLNKAATDRWFAVIGLFLSGTFLLQAWHAGAENIWTKFEPGSAISSSAVNNNFENLDDRIAKYESAVFVGDDNSIGIGTNDVGRMVPEPSPHFS